MATTEIKSRIMLKYDTETNWNTKKNFIPKEGEVIIYSADNQNTSPRLKVGDGETTLIDLPFIVEPMTNDDIDSASPLN